MNVDLINLNIVLILTIGFALASLFGYLTWRINLSPILGYLIAGYVIGPYFPGYVADLTVAEELAEIGVILMMFSVGLHFNLTDLANVKNIAIPGAIIQTFVATCAAVLLMHFVGWSTISGIIFGLAIGVASTVILVRVLSDNHLLNTKEGHISIGWLIVEDVITVLILILIPTLISFSNSDLLNVLQSFGWVLIKLALFVVVMALWGCKIVEYALSKIMDTHLHELFTLSVLAFIFIIAAGSTLALGTSLALGAFIAGMVLGQTKVRHQALAHSLPIKNAFLVIFFLAVGMLFNPYTIIEHFYLTIAVLGIILAIKPLTAFIITKAYNYPYKTALVVAFSLAQIGEFSFILSEEAQKFDLIPDEGYDIIVACALISIAINPLFFKSGLVDVK